MSLVKRFILTIPTVVSIISLAFSTSVFAANLTSTNYRIIDSELTTTSGSSSSTNYKNLTAGAGGIGYTQVSSSLYKTGNGQGYTFMANVPKIQCFETTTTSGTTQCSSLPNGNGMIGECGGIGCYDRAMLQIDIQSNPTDTLYLIEITPDNWTTTYNIDGTTHIPETSATKTIADYKTKAQWENSPWNSTDIVGLQPNKTYQARVKALQGDFTETPAGPTASATTVTATLSFDLNISCSSSTQTNPPYSLSFGKIVPESPAIIATSDCGGSSPSAIYVVLDTNAADGASAYVQDSNNGLYSPSKSYTLASASEDLSNSASGDGFGLKLKSASGTYTVTTSIYNTSGTYEVGAVSTSATKLFCLLSSGTCSSGTTHFGSANVGYNLIARASLAAKAANDYQDTLTFTAMGF